MSEQAIKVSASLLAADFANLGDAVCAAEAAGCDELHFDVMDGHFVPNISFGIPILEAVRPLTTLPIDVHMMVTEPARYAGAFAKAGGDVFTIHVEACQDVDASIDAACAAGMRPALSVKPATPASEIASRLDRVDRALVMTVEPGFGGQSFMHEMLPKIEELRDVAIERGIDLEIAVDGGIKVNTAPTAIKAGARTLVSGTGVFGYPDGLAAAVRALKSCGHSQTNR